MEASARRLAILSAIATVLVGVSMSAAASISMITGANKSQESIAVGSVRAGVVTPIDVTGVPSMDSVFSPNNAVVFVEIGAGNSVNGIGWNVMLQTLHPDSLLSDILVLVTDSTGLGGFSLRPGFADQTSGGPSSYDSDGQILKLANYSIPDVIAMGDGLIRLEFVDYVDDAVGVADGQWVSGSLFLQTYVPIPNASAVSLLAIAGIAGLGRRRP